MSGKSLIPLNDGKIQSLPRKKCDTHDCTHAFLTNEVFYFIYMVFSSLALYASGEVVRTQKYFTSVFFMSE